VHTKISIQLIRHATLLINIGPYQFLVDPMLSAKYAMEPVQNAGNSIRIPMTDMPFNQQRIDDIVSSVDAVIVTHTHRDHWDNDAQQRIPKDKLILCQPSDVDAIKSQGFLNVNSFQDLAWKEVLFYRTGGQHGTGEIGEKMGTVSGVILKYKSEILYLAGDTIWCYEVKEAIDEYKPTAIVLNSGAAQFLTGGPITMNSEDVVSILEYAGEAKIIAVHMDTINHCHLSRSSLQRFLHSKNVDHKLLIPFDGDVINI
jgi:L-ascorbate metabolism protein UlaG (beta-lactamase superfamily)